MNESIFEESVIQNIVSQISFTAIDNDAPLNTKFGKLIFKAVRTNDIYETIFLIDEIEIHQFYKLDIQILKI